MENQHRQIKGYRELNEAEIAAMNEIKAKGAELGALLGNKPVSVSSGYRSHEAKKAGVKP